MSKSYEEEKEEETKQMKNSGMIGSSTCTAAFSYACHTAHLVAVRKACGWGQQRDGERMEGGRRLNEKMH